jgi:hypothetical protein
MTTPPHQPKTLPPKKRTDFPNPLLMLIIIGIIVVGIAAFLILRPNPSGNTPKATPASQQ